MADELIDVFDENMNPLGTAMKYKAHAEGFWHKIFFCWIINRMEDGKYYALFQLRNKNKCIGGGLLDASSAGHFAAGENLEQALCREVSEELGLKLDFNKITTFGIGKHKSNNEKIRNNEIVHKCYALTSIKLSDLKLQRDELDGIFAMEISDAIRLFSDDIAKTDISGMIFDENGNYIAQKRQVSVADFMDYGKTVYRDFFSELKQKLNL